MRHVPEYNFDSVSFFDENLPTITTIGGCEAINKWIRKGQYHPIVKLLYFPSDTGIELNVYQNQETLEVRQVYKGQPIPEEDGYLLILTGIVPVFYLMPFVQAYMVPNGIKAGDHVFIPKIIEDLKGLIYLNHNGGVIARFDGKDMKFTETPRRKRMYRD